MNFRVLIGISEDVPAIGSEVETLTAFPSYLKVLYQFKDSSAPPRNHRLEMYFTTSSDWITSSEVLLPCHQTRKVQGALCTWTLPHVQKCAEASPYSPTLSNLTIRFSQRETWVPIGVVEVNSTNTIYVDNCNSEGIFFSGVYFYDLGNDWIMVWLE